MKEGIPRHTGHRFILHMRLSPRRPEATHFSSIDVKQWPLQKVMQSKCEHQNWSLYQWRIVWWFSLSFIKKNGSICLNSYAVESLEPRSPGCKQTCGYNMMVWNMFHWKRSSPSFYVKGTLSHKKHFNILEDTVYRFRTTMSPVVLLEVCEKTFSNR